MSKAQLERTEPEDAWAWEYEALEKNILMLRSAVLEPGFAQLPSLRQAQIRTNLGNAYISLGRHDDAKGAYETALEHGRSAITLYNLSQVYRDELNYPVGDKYYDEALAEDRALVTSFTPRAGKTPNRLVVDMTFGWRKLWSLISE